MSKYFCKIFPLILIYLHGICGYQDFLLHDLCPSNPLKKAFNKLMDNKPEIRLGENGESAALVHQNWNSSSFKRFDECSFNVDTSRGDKKSRISGLYVSIKRLNLRRHGTVGECIDYVRFKFGDKKTHKICGQIDATTNGDYDHYNFDVKGGLTKVYLSIDKLLPLQRTEDTLDIELVFTAYESCGGMYNVQCPSAYFNTCISMAFRDDGIINCPPPHCNDELAKCPQIIVHGSPDLIPNKSNIVLSAITSLIFTLVAVGSCFWICWKIKDCLVGEASNVPASDRRSERRNRSPTIDTGLNDGDVALNLAPSSTSTDDQSAFYRPSAPPIEDKQDLPPAYDELYPGQSTK